MDETTDALAPEEAAAVVSEPEADPALDDGPVAEDGPAVDEVAPAQEQLPESVVDSEPFTVLAIPEGDGSAPGGDGLAQEQAAPTQAPPRTAARYVAEALRAAGVRYAFTVPGESFLPLIDALVEANIRVIASRHEGGASFMAEAYGQLTGRPGAVLGTRAVGAANMAIGIQTAREDSTPLFAIAGQVERTLRGRDAFQEADLAGSIGRLAKWSGEVSEADALPAVVTEAVRQALGGRPGPVFLSLPEDLLADLVPGDAALPAPPRGNGDRPDPGAVHSVLQLLASATRPVILAGAGVLRARCSNDLVRLAELLRVPVMAAWRRPDVFPNDHPLYLGMTGYGSPPCVRERLEAADALLVLGCRLSEVTSFGYTVPRPGLRWAHADLAPRASRNGLHAPDIAVLSDARAFLRAAIGRLGGSVLDAAVVDDRVAATEADRAAWEAASVVDDTAWDGPGVHPGRIVAALRRILPDNAILTTDAGNFGGWAARGYRFRRPGTFLGPTSGAMGYGLPAAIVAALVHRDRPVVALTGDGGFAMTMAELETAVRERARLVALVFDNERYGTIRMHQDMADGGRPAATDLGPIDFAAVARGLGADGVRVEADAEFEPALTAALAADRPTVIHLPLDRRWVSVDDRPGD